ncbi:MAG: hypothetical protein P4L46_16640 [Fimbriimonas sp.]|nr:hypothetical protein [Fimbriimonas sp.]
MIELVLAAFALSIHTRGPIPTPAQTPVSMVVSGRTSTLQSITVQGTGNEIPATFSGVRLKNVPRFGWWVSRHYALQTDYPPDRAKHLLTILELAYPHYVEFFGREPAGIAEKRMAVVYGSSKESLKTAMDADGIQWDFNGGGITYEGLNAAFNYPSGSLQYHQRYIVLHECVHLFQDCLYGATMTTPSWFYEGIADGISHHVWEADKQRLTVSVFDKPTVNNWLDSALTEYAKSPFKASDILDEKRGGRALGFLLVNYFESDPEREARFRIWRDELMRLAKYRAYQEDSKRLIEQLFGASRLDSDFDAWVRARKSSFHYVDWGWEQDGDALMSYGFPQTGTYSQTNLQFPPKERPAFDPLRMDYPLHPQSRLVGAVHRGISSPTVGCLVGFERNPDGGMCGLGLGVQDRSMLAVLVDRRRTLVVDATALGGESRALPLTDAFVKASGKTYEIGLTIRIADEGIEVTARAGDDPNGEVAHLNMVLSSEQIQRLLSDPVAVLSRGGLHWVTPYVDDARRWSPPLEALSPPNRWSFAMQPVLRSLVRASWRLGSDSPSSLTALVRPLASAAVESNVDAARRAYGSAIAKVLSDVKASQAPPESRQAALTDLASVPKG